jgi:dihydroflavonol-4-reductase
MGHVVVTGGTGFIGSAVVRQLVAAGREVLVVVEPGADEANLDGIEVDRVSADILDMKAMEKALDGAEAFYHLAAIYRVWMPNPSVIYRVNVEGTMTALLAAQKAKVPKVVYTASIAAVGDREDGRPSDESAAFNLHAVANEYILTKHLSERIALRFAEAGMPIVVVNPAFPFGERDRAPTPTGQIVCDLANGRTPGMPPGGFNAVDVEIVAEGHLLAEEKGRVGERYILGDHNLTYVEFARLVARLLGTRASDIILPSGATVAAAWLMEMVADHITHRPPPATAKTAQYAATNHFFDVSKARRELGLRSIPLEDSIRRSIAWFRENDYISEENRRIF